MLVKFTDSISSISNSSLTKFDELSISTKRALDKLPDQFASHKESASKAISDFIMQQKLDIQTNAKLIMTSAKDSTKATLSAAMEKMQAGLDSMKSTFDSAKSSISQSIESSESIQGAISALDEAYGYVSTKVPELLSACNKQFNDALEYVGDTEIPLIKYINADMEMSFKDAFLKCGSALEKFHSGTLAPFFNDAAEKISVIVSEEFSNLPTISQETVFSKLTDIKNSVAGLFTSTLESIKDYVAQNQEAKESIDASSNSVVDEIAVNEGSEDTDVQTNTAAEEEQVAVVSMDDGQTVLQENLEVQNEVSEEAAPVEAQVLDTRVVEEPEDVNMQTNIEEQADSTSMTDSEIAAEANVISEEEVVQVEEILNKYMEAASAKIMSDMSSEVSDALNIQDYIGNGSDMVQDAVSIDVASVDVSGLAAHEYHEELPIVKPIYSGEHQE